MQRASLSISEDSESEKSDFEAWSTRWKDKMTIFSDDYGCGCCVHLYDVEGPEEAIEAIPQALRTTSEWTEASKQKK